MSSPQTGLLEAATAEIEAHVATSGWDQRPALFAIVRSARLAADDPDAAARLGLDAAAGDALIPVEQEELPEGPLDEALGQLAWPPGVAGCALSQEILILPPSAEADLPDESGDLAAVANHPERREARLVVAVLRPGPGPGEAGGASEAHGAAAAMLRLRGRDGAGDGELLTGAELAPNLVAALLATFGE